MNSPKALSDAENSSQTAFASARTAASRDPLAIEPLYLLSVLYQGAHDKASARAELVKASQIQPENPQVWLWLGELDATTGRPEAAIAELRNALSLDLPVTPDTTNAQAALAHASAQLARRQAAAVKAKAKLSSPKRRRARAGTRGVHPGERPRRHR